MNTRFISINKHEFNVRRVSELNEVILAKEEELRNTKGFINTMKVKLELRKLYKQITVHGSEVMAFETSKLNSIN